MERLNSIFCKIRCTMIWILVILPIAGCFSSNNVNVSNNPEFSSLIHKSGNLSEEMVLWRLNDGYLLTRPVGHQEPNIIASLPAGTTIVLLGIYQRHYSLYAYSSYVVTISLEYPPNSGKKIVATMHLAATVLNDGTKCGDPIKSINDLIKLKSNNSP